MCPSGEDGIDGENLEDVLVVPQQLTQSAYATLKKSGVVPQPWHLEGRFGSRTHRIDSKRIGLPILSKEVLNKKSETCMDLQELLKQTGVSVMTKPYFYNYRFRDPIEVDGRIHPEKETKEMTTEKANTSIDVDESSSVTSKKSLFTYAELFAGIGGFGVALEALGGECVFMSELEENIRALYCHNFETTNVHGDIYEVDNSEFPKSLDLLVGGFPCQPFSALGTQSGFNCEKGRGQLYLEIVRMLGVSRPKAFLLENVPGLLTMTETYETILATFQKAGYRIKTEVCSARGLTSTTRKRLFFVGIRNDIDTPPFQFPFVPDLKIRAQDILDYDTLSDEEMDILRLSDTTFAQLLQNRRWRPAHMAWPNRVCDTITSHYGNSVGRGESQLVPCHAPHRPRRFSIRECARLMGFPSYYKFLPQGENQGDMAYRKDNYRKLGNAVCPPLIAALAGAVLAHCQLDSDKHIDWTKKGRDTAVAIALACTRSKPVTLPTGCMVVAGEDAETSAADSQESS